MDPIRAARDNRRVPALLRCVVLVAVVAGAPACERDQCSGPNRCDGNVAVNCVEIPDGEIGSHLEREDTDCFERFCHTPADGVEGEAFCALASAPDPDAPAMAAELANATGCRDGRFVVWQYGYRIAEDDCGEGWVCVDERAGLAPPCGAEGFCALADAPDPRCAPGIGTTCVDDETLLQCRCGFAQSESTCSDAAPFCVLEPFAELPEQGVCRDAP